MKDIKDIKETLSELSAIISPPSGENKVTEYIKEYIMRAAPDAELSSDALGTLYVALKGSCGPTVALSASVDESVFVANDADENGNIRFASLGVLSPSSAAYAEAEFENGVRGTIFPMKKNDPLSDDPLKYGVDIGASGKDEALSAVPPGTAFRPSSSLLVKGDLITGPSVAAKAGIAVLLETSRFLSEKVLKGGVVLVFMTQGKVGARSAGPAAVMLSPSAAVSVVAVPEDCGRKVPLGNGPAAVATTGYTVADPRVRDALGVPSVVVSPQRKPDDGIAAARYISAGVPAGVLGIPARYEGTARETVNIRDIFRAAEVLSEFVNGEF